MAFLPRRGRPKGRPYRWRRNAIAAVAVTLVIAATLGPPAAAWNGCGICGNGVPPEWVTIATVEHTRGDAALLKPFLDVGTDRETRARAIVALGRIGPRGAVPQLLRDLMTLGGDDLPLVLWSAGLTRDKSLLPDVLPYLKSQPPGSKKPAVVAAAVQAAGYLADAKAGEAILPLLDDPSEPVREAACLALGRLRDDKNLEAVLAKFADPSAAVRWKAAAAAWPLCGARKKAKTPKEGGDWEGDVKIALRLTALEKDPDPDVRMFGSRALGLVLPPSMPLAQPPSEGSDDAARLWYAVGRIAGDPDPRVVADACSRIFATRKGKGAILALDAASRNDDPIAREAAADALGEQPDDEAVPVLYSMQEREKDVRVQEAIAIALAAHGRTRVVNSYDDGSRLTADVGLTEGSTQLTYARILLAWKAGGRGAELTSLARASSTPGRVRAEILDGLSKKDGPEIVPLAKEFLKAPDFVVRGNAVSLLGAKGGAEAASDLVPAYTASAGRPYQDVRIEIVKALGKIAADPTAPPARAAEARETVKAALSDKAPTVRLAAREAAALIPGLEAESKKEDAEPNEWFGLPRPKKPILGVDLTCGGPWLSEEEILCLADAIARRCPRIHVVSDVGEFVLTLDACAAPVHAVNLVLLAEAGTYDGTTWHRVVPAFVIQGGDPRGDGSGDAGYAIPDEITALPYVRGALGMPKNTKDTGGCQMFVMHAAYPPLNMNYTCFGRVLSGMETVDRIRVGDRVLSVRVEDCCARRGR